MQTLSTRSRFVTYTLAILLMFSGCTKVGPDYQRPELATDAQFENTTTEQEAPEQVVQVDWWKSFEDTELDGFIHDAIQGSNDLQILFNRIKVAGALIDESEADLYPSVDLGASGTIEDNVEQGASESYRLGGQLSWELDLWGKNRRRLEAQQAEQRAAKADYRAGYLALVGDTATAYFSIRQYDSLRSVAAEYIEFQDLVRAIYEQQYLEGIIGDDKLLQQRALLNQTRQESLEMERGRAIQEHKLAALTGKPPGQVKVPVNGSGPFRLPVVPVGLPSSLLERRPDILAAEHRLAKATQGIGIAEAARLPSISLTMEGGLTSTSLASLLSGGFLSFMPKITLPIFDGGRGKAEVEKAIYEVEIAKNEWAKVANKAFQEVADELTNLNNRKTQLVLLEAQVADLLKVREQLKAQFELGMISHLELNDVMTTLYEAEKNVEKMKTQLINATVLLYKALGGGWPAGEVG